MVLTSDSDDDFVSTPKDFWLFKNNKSGPSSSNKKRKKQPLKKSLTKSPATPKKKKLKLDQVEVKKSKSISNHYVYGNGPLVLRDQCSLNILEVLGSSRSKLETMY